MPHSVTVTFECPEELHDEMMDEVDGSPAHENRSQFIRYAMRKALADQSDFEAAR